MSCTQLQAVPSNCAEHHAAPDGSRGSMNISTNHPGRVAQLLFSSELPAGPSHQQLPLCELWHDPSVSPG